MIGRTTPYQPTAGTNLNHAELISTKMAVSMIKRSKKPLLILGEKDECSKMLEELKNYKNLEIIHTPKEGNLIKCIKYAISNNNDLVIFAGITYYYLAQCITHLKHFSNITTLTIDRYYHPNAHYSFPNMEVIEHEEALKRLIMLLND